MKKYISEKYRSLKSEYLNRTPLKKWDFVRKIGAFVLILLGIPTLSPKFVIRWYIYGGLVGIVDFFASTLYTTFYFAGSDEPLKAILALALFGTVIPVNDEKFFILILQLNCFLFQTTFLNHLK